MARREHLPGEPRSTSAIRLGTDERGDLKRAAELRGITVSEYIRSAALEAARRELARKHREG